MKSFSLASLAVLLCFNCKVFAQHPKELPPGYYVVVAAFSPDREVLAENFTAGLTKKGMDAKYGFNSERYYYYVYVKHSTKRQPCIEEMQQLRGKPEFSKTWVRKVVPYKPPVGKMLSNVKAEDQTQEPALTTSAEVIPATDTNSVSIDPADTIVVTDNPEIVQYEHMDLENTEVFLSLFNAANNRVVEGKVKVIDTEKSKLITEVNGNDYLHLPNPRTATGQITLVCEAFGYRKVQQEINYPMPMADTAKHYVDLMGTTFIVYFDLVRYYKGDIATLYQVFFYNDAAVMLPESKYELNTLLQMMQENPAYRIRLHGHTNGNYRGKIVLMGDNKDFFSLNGSKKTSGSAKDLSRARAEIIKDYLVTNGIDASRIEVKAWAGKRPIYDKHSANAKRNVRVEVEILEDK